MKISIRELVSGYKRDEESAEMVAYADFVESNDSSKYSGGKDSSRAESAEAESRARLISALNISASLCIKTRKEMP